MFCTALLLRLSHDILLLFIHFYGVLAWWSGRCLYAEPDEEYNSLFCWNITILLTRKRFTIDESLEPCENWFPDILKGVTSLHNPIFKYILLSFPLTFHLLHFFVQRHKLECLSCYVCLHSTPAEPHHHPHPHTRIIFRKKREWMSEWTNGLLYLAKGS